jgi:hypothetical protein
MPFKDPERRLAVERERKRRARPGAGGSWLSAPPLTYSVRLRRRRSTRPAVICGPAVAVSDLVPAHCFISPAYSL